MNRNSSSLTDGTDRLTPPSAADIPALTQDSTGVFRSHSSREDANTDANEHPLSKDNHHRHHHHSNSGTHGGAAYRDVSSHDHHDIGSIFAKTVRTISDGSVTPHSAASSGNVSLDHMPRPFHLPRGPSPHTGVANTYHCTMSHASAASAFASHPLLCGNQRMTGVGVDGAPRAVLMGQIPPLSPAYSQHYYSQRQHQQHSWDNNDGDDVNLHPFPLPQPFCSAAAMPNANTHAATASAVLAALTDIDSVLGALALQKRYQHEQSARIRSRERSPQCRIEEQQQQQRLPQPRQLDARKSRGRHWRHSRDSAQSGRHGSAGRMRGVLPSRAPTSSSFHALDAANSWSAATPCAMGAYTLSPGNSVGAFARSAVDDNNPNTNSGSGLHQPTVATSTTGAAAAAPAVSDGDGGVAPGSGFSSARSARSLNTSSDLPRSSMSQGGYEADNRGSPRWPPPRQGQPQPQQQAQRVDHSHADVRTPPPPGPPHFPQATTPSALHPKAATKGSEEEGEGEDEDCHSDRQREHGDDGNQTDRALALGEESDSSEAKALGTHISPFSVYSPRFRDVHTRRASEVVLHRLRSLLASATILADHCGINLDRCVRSQVRAVGQDPFAHSFARHQQQQQQQPTPSEAHRQAHEQPLLPSSRPSTTDALAPHRTSSAGGQTGDTSASAATTAAAAHVQRTTRTSVSGRSHLRHAGRSESGTTQGNAVGGNSGVGSPLRGRHASFSAFADTSGDPLMRRKIAVPVCIAEIAADASAARPITASPSRAPPPPPPPPATAIAVASDGSQRPVGGMKATSAPIVDPPTSPPRTPFNGSASRSTGGSGSRSAPTGATASSRGIGSGGGGHGGCSARRGTGREGGSRRSSSPQSTSPSPPKQQQHQQQTTTTSSSIATPLSHASHSYTLPSSMRQNSDSPSILLPARSGDGGGLGGAGMASTGPSLTRSLGASSGLYARPSTHMTEHLRGDAERYGSGPPGHELRSYSHHHHHQSQSSSSNSTSASALGGVACTHANAEGSSGTGLGSHLERVPPAARFAASIAMTSPLATTTASTSAAATANESSFTDKKTTSASGNTETKVSANASEYGLVAAVPPLAPPAESSQTPVGATSLAPSSFPPRSPTPRLPARADGRTLMRHFQSANAHTQTATREECVHPLSVSAAANTMAHSDREGSDDNTNHRSDDDDDAAAALSSHNGTYANHGGAVLMMSNGIDQSRDSGCHSGGGSRSWSSRRDDCEEGEAAATDLVLGQERDDTLSVSASVTRYRGHSQLQQQQRRQTEDRSEKHECTAAHEAQMAGDAEQQAESGSNAASAPLATDSVANDDVKDAPEATPSTSDADVKRHDRESSASHGPNAGTKEDSNGESAFHVENACSRAAALPLNTAMTGRDGSRRQWQKKSQRPPSDDSTTPTTTAETNKPSGFSMDAPHTSLSVHAPLGFSLQSRTQNGRDSGSDGAASHDHNHNSGAHAGVLAAAVTVFGRTITATAAAVTAAPSMRTERTARAGSDHDCDSKEVHDGGSSSNNTDRDSRGSHRIRGTDAMSSSGVCMSANRRRLSTGEPDVSLLTTRAPNQESSAPDPSPSEEEDTHRKGDSDASEKSDTAKGKWRMDDTNEEHDGVVEGTHEGAYTMNDGGGDAAAFPGANESAPESASLATDVLTPHIAPAVHGNTFNDTVMRNPSQSGGKDGSDGSSDSGPQLASHTMRDGQSDGASCSLPVRIPSSTHAYSDSNRHWPHQQHHEQRHHSDFASSSVHAKDAAGGDGAAAIAAPTTTGTTRDDEGAAVTTTAAAAVNVHSAVPSALPSSAPSAAATAQTAGTMTALITRKPPGDVDNGALNAEEVATPTSAAAVATTTAPAALTATAISLTAVRSDSARRGACDASTEGKHAREEGARAAGAEPSAAEGKPQVKAEETDDTVTPTPEQTTKVSEPPHEASTHRIGRPEPRSAKEAPIAGAPPELSPPAPADRQDQGKGSITDEVANARGPLAIEQMAFVSFAPAEEGWLDPECVYVDSDESLAGSARHCHHHSLNRHERNETVLRDKSPDQPVEVDNSRQPDSRARDADTGAHHPNVHWERIQRRPADASVPGEGEGSSTDAIPPAPRTHHDARSLHSQPIPLASLRLSPAEESVLVSSTSLNVGGGAAHLSAAPWGGRTEGNDSGEGQERRDGDAGDAGGSGNDKEGCFRRVVAHHRPSVEPAALEAAAAVFAPAMSAIASPTTTATTMETDAAASTGRGRGGRREAPEPNMCGGEEESVADTDLSAVKNSHPFADSRSLTRLRESESACATVSAASALSTAAAASAPTPKVTQPTTADVTDPVDVYPPHSRSTTAVSAAAGVALDVSQDERHGMSAAESLSSQSKRNSHRPQLLVCASSGGHPNRRNRTHDYRQPRHHKFRRVRRKRDSDEEAAATTDDSPADLLLQLPIPPFYTTQMQRFIEGRARSEQKWREQHLGSSPASAGGGNSSGRGLVSGSRGGSSGSHVQPLNPYPSYRSRGGHHSRSNSNSNSNSSNGGDGQMLNADAAVAAARSGRHPSASPIQLCANDHSSSGGSLVGTSSSGAGGHTNHPQTPSIGSGHVRHHQHPQHQPQRQPTPQQQQQFRPGSSSGGGSAGGGGGYPYWSNSAGESIQAALSPSPRDAKHTATPICEEAPASLRSPDGAINRYHGNSQRHDDCEEIASHPESSARRECHHPPFAHVPPAVAVTDNVAAGDDLREGHGKDPQQVDRHGVDKGLFMSPAVVAAAMPSEVEIVLQRNVLQRGPDTTETNRGGMRDVDCEAYPTERDDDEKQEPQQQRRDWNGCGDGDKEDGGVAPTAPVTTESALGASPAIPVECSAVQPGRLSSSDQLTSRVTGQRSRNCCRCGEHADNDREDGEDTTCRRPAEDKKRNSDGEVEANVAHDAGKREDEEQTEQEADGTCISEAVSASSPRPPDTCTYGGNQHRSDLAALSRTAADDSSATTNTNSGGSSSSSPRNRHGAASPLFTTLTEAYVHRRNAEDADALLSVLRRALAELASAAEADTGPTFLDLMPDVRRTTDAATVVPASDDKQDSGDAHDGKVEKASSEDKHGGGVDVPGTRADKRSGLPNRFHPWNQNGVYSPGSLTCAPPMGTETNSIGSSLIYSPLAASGKAGAVSPGGAAASAVAAIPCTTLAFASVPTAATHAQPSLTAKVASFGSAPLEDPQDSSSESLVCSPATASLAVVSLRTTATMHTVHNATQGGARSPVMLEGIEGSDARESGSTVREGGDWNCGRDGGQTHPKPRTAAGSLACGRSWPGRVHSGGSKRNHNSHHGHDGATSSRSGVGGSLDILGAAAAARAMRISSGAAVAGTASAGPMTLGSDVPPLSVSLSVSASGEYYLHHDRMTNRHNSNNTTTTTPWVSALDPPSPDDGDTHHLAHYRGYSAVSTMAGTDFDVSGCASYVDYDTVGLQPPLQQEGSLRPMRMPSNSLSLSSPQSDPRSSQQLQFQRSPSTSLNTRGGNGNGHSNSNSHSYSNGNSHGGAGVDGRGLLGPPSRGASGIGLVAGDAGDHHGRHSSDRVRGRKLSPGEANDGAGSSDLSVGFGGDRDPDLHLGEALHAHLSDPDSGLIDQLIPFYYPPSDGGGLADDSARRRVDSTATLPPPPVEDEGKKVARDRESERTTVTGGVAGASETGAAAAAVGVMGHEVLTEEALNPLQRIAVPVAVATVSARARPTVPGSIPTAAATTAHVGAAAATITMSKNAPLVTESGIYVSPSADYALSGSMELSARDGECVFGATNRSAPAVAATEADLLTSSCDASSGRAPPSQTAVPPPTVLLSCPPTREANVERREVLLSELKPTKSKMTPNAVIGWRSNEIEVRSNKDELSAAVRAGAAFSVGAAFAPPSSDSSIHGRPEHVEEAAVVPPSAVVHTRQEETGCCDMHDQSLTSAPKTKTAAAVPTITTEITVDGVKSAALTSESSNAAPRKGTSESPQERNGERRHAEKESGKLAHWRPPSGISSSQEQRSPLLDAARETSRGEGHAPLSTSSFNLLLAAAKTTAATTLATDSTRAAAVGAGEQIVSQLQPPQPTRSLPQSDMHLCSTRQALTLTRENAFTRNYARLITRFEAKPITGATTTSTTAAAAAVTTAIANWCQPSTAANGFTRLGMANPSAAIAIATDSATSCPGVCHHFPSDSSFSSSSSLPLPPPPQLHSTANSMSSPPSLFSASRHRLGVGGARGGAVPLPASIPVRDHRRWTSEDLIGGEEDAGLLVWEAAGTHGHRGRAARSSYFP